ncbi:MAG: hypothetical protein JJU46_04995 [Balneolaceae bacterium]|nr:hypothetical protein [Balneolaceae bacterium]MCH8548482.1 hypothetical protein [Balneolaceae bacterium]
MTWSLLSRQIVMFSVLTLLIGACASEQEADHPEPMGEEIESEEGIESHPQSDLVPHADVRPEQPEVHSLAEIESELPETILMVADLIDADSYNGREIDLLYRNLRNLNAASLDSGRLLFMENHVNRFVIYDVESEEVTELAEEGRGPDDLMFTREMQLENDVAWISMQGFRVSGFDCSGESCEYDRTIPTQTNNYSVAVDGDELTILGLPPFGFEDSPGPDETISQYILHRYSSDGDSLGMYSPVYQHLNPLVREMMSAEGIVRHDGENGRTILISKRLPFIYLYDDEELVAKYRIPNFIQGYYDQREGENMPEGQVIGYERRELEKSRIHYGEVVDDRWLVLSFTTTTDIEGADMSKPGSIPESFNLHSKWYVMDLATDQLYKIGREDVSENREERHYYITRHGVVLAKETGAVWFPV